MTARDTVMTIRRPSPQPNGVLAGAVLRGSTKIVALLALSVALIGAFVAIELRSQPPLVPFRIFRFRTLTGANVVGILLGAPLFSMFFFISPPPSASRALPGHRGPPLVAQRVDSRENGCAGRVCRL